MKFFSRVSKKELLDYVCLEEDEDTAERLIKASFLYVGSATRGGVTFDYWSYPTPCGVAWVSCSSDNALGTEVDADIPPTIRDSTAPCEVHPVRKSQREALLPVDRTPVAAPTWIPFKSAPACNYYPVWHECIPFPHVAKAFGARSARVDVGYPQLCICIKLTAGRYALIETPADRQQSISISLELGEDAETRKDKNCIGFVHISDIKEILAALGQEYRAPVRQFPYQWRD